MPQGFHRTAERRKEFSRGLSERSERYPRSAQPRVPRNPQGARTYRIPFPGVARFALNPRLNSLHRSAVQQKKPY